MRRRTKLSIVASGLLAAFFLSGCVTTWTYPSGPVVAGNKAYSISFPAGWTYMPLPGGDTLMATYDGPNLQVIRVICYDLREEMPYSKNKLASDLSSEDLADAIFQEIFKEPGVNGPVLEMAGPGSLDGVGGAQVVYSYTNDEGLRYRGNAIAAIYSKHLYVVLFAAPVRHYYELYDDVIDRSVESFRFTKK